MKFGCRFCFLMILIVMIFAAWPAKSAAQQLSPTEIDRQADALLSKLSIEQKIKLIGGHDGMFTYAMPEIGLPQLKMSDGPLGVRTWGPSTAYAAGISLAASWDKALARQIGISLGRDARARGVNFLLGPAVDIYREPMNGRNMEYFGEDPYLAARMAVNYIEGVQSRDVVATIKHYALNNQEYDRHNENSIVDERTLHEIYLPAFEAAVKQARVGAVMDSYNLIDGEHATQNKMLDTSILKDWWGFRGILMSDWGATYDGIAAANAGLDLEMPSAKYMNPQTLLPAIREGKVSVATIDDKVRRILRVAIRFGFLKNHQTDLQIPLFNQQSNEVALKSAEEGLVLLKNEGHLLPLDPHKVHSIAVIGPDAYPAVPGGGGSSEVTAFAPKSFMIALSNTIAAMGGGRKVYWSRGVKDVEAIFSGSDLVSSRFSTDPQGTHAGLKQEVFANSSFSGSPYETSTVPHVDYWRGRFGKRLQRPDSAVRWSGYYTPRKSGAQRFVAVGLNHDTFRLYVNGKLVLQETEHGGMAPLSADVDLPAGKPAAVRFDYVPQTQMVHASLGVLPADEMLEPNVKQIAAQADFVVLSVGFGPRTESEGFDRTFHLPFGQVDLIKAVTAANPHTIVVVTSGGSVATSAWLSRTPALIEDWYGGQAAGTALAQVLFGRVNPSGKLPISWERRQQDNPCFKNYYEQPGTRNIVYREGIFLGYRYYDQSKTKPLFPFGFGLSYTSFRFSNLQVSPEQTSPEGPITVSLNVTNTGDVAGAEVAEVYVGDPSARVRRPVKELKGFERVVLNPGETKHVSISLDRRALAYWDVNSHGWKVDPGKFMIYAGDSSGNVPLKAAFVVR